MDDERVYVTKNFSLDVQELSSISRTLTYVVNLKRLREFLKIVPPFLFQLKEYSQKAVEILRTQNHILTNHPNSNIYKYVYTNILCVPRIMKLKVTNNND